VGEIVGRAEHADAVQADVLLAWVVVDEADRRVAAGGSLEHLADNELRGVARPHHDHFLPARNERCSARPLDQAAGDQAGSGDECEQDQPVEHRDRSRQREPVDRVREVHDEVGDDARRGDAARRAPHVASRDVTPPAVVEAERDEDRELDRDHDQDRVDQQAVVRARHALVEAQPEREPTRRRQSERRPRAAARGDVC